MPRRSMRKLASGSFPSTLEAEPTEGASGQSPMLAIFDFQPSKEA